MSLLENPSSVLSSTLRPDDNRGASTGSPQTESDHHDTHARRNDEATAVNGDPRLVVFAFGEVVVQAASADHRVDGTPAFDGMPAFNRWPCPGCGMRRLVNDVQILQVADLPGDRNVREIMVCAVCAMRVQQAPPYRIVAQGREIDRADAL